MRIKHTIVASTVTTNNLSTLLIKEIEPTTILRKNVNSQIWLLTKLVFQTSWEMIQNCNVARTRE